MTNAVLQPEPAERDGAGWVVFEQLMEQEIADPTALERMTHEQRLVFALYYLRQEVNSGGFDAYFRYSGGNTAVLAAEAARNVSPRWGQLVEDACRPFGSPYPADIDTRERVVESLAQGQPDLFESLDERLYELEAEVPVDDSVDAFIWSSKAAFFR